MDHFAPTIDPLEASVLPDRPDGLAMWRRIADALRAEITRGELIPGGRLPTGAALAASFRVNRHTARRALDELARSGLVRIERGRGSFVADDVLDYAVGPRTRFSEWVRAQNREPSGRVLELATIAADASVAAGLGVPTGVDVVMLKRLGLADGRPVCIGWHYFPAARFPGLLYALGNSDSVSAALTACGLPDYRRALTRVTARLPDAEEARLLAIGGQRPVLVTENVNVDSDGAIVEFGIGLYPTPRVQIVFEPVAPTG
jgi:GntR family phosphonate transport system transcriptional regulator